MIYDAKLFVGSDLTIVGSGLPATLGSTIDLLNISGDVRDLVMVIRCSEKPVVSAGTPIVQFLATVGDTDTLGSVTSLVQVGCSPFMCCPDATISHHLNGVLPEVGEITVVPLWGPVGFTQGASLGAKGPGIDPGEMLATLGRRYLGVQMVNLLNVLIPGSSTYSAGKFDIWFAMATGTDSGPRTFPSGFRV